MNTGNTMEPPANQPDDRRSAKTRPAEQANKSVWEGGEIHPDDIDDTDGEYIAGKAQSSDEAKPENQGKTG